MVLTKGCRPPGSNIGTEHQTRNAAKGELLFDELRILTSKEHYLEIYSLCLIWRPSFIGVSNVEIGGSGQCDRFCSQISVLAGLPMMP
jgi:hypothetical protein